MILPPPRSTLFPYTTLFRSVLHDRDTGAGQQRVCGARTVCRVVDVEGVDAHQGRTGRDEMLRCGPRQEGMAGAIALGAPIDVPAGVYEHRSAPHGPPAEHACVERPAGALSCPNHAALEVGEGLERTIGNVTAAVVAVERRIDVGAGVGEQLDLPGLECRAWGV